MFCLFLVRILPAQFTRYLRLTTANIVPLWVYSLHHLYYFFFVNTCCCPIIDFSGDDTLDGKSKIKFCCCYCGPTTVCTRRKRKLYSLLSALCRDVFAFAQAKRCGAGCPGGICDLRTLAQPATSFIACDPRRLSLSLPWPNHPLPCLTNSFSLSRRIVNLILNLAFNTDRAQKGQWRGKFVPDEELQRMPGLRLD